MTDLRKSTMVPASLLLGNHLIALLIIEKDPNVRIRELSVAVGLTERSGQRIVNELEEAGVIAVTRSGRRNVYAVNRGAVVGLQNGSTVHLAELLGVFSPEPPGRSPHTGNGADH